MDESGRHEFHGTAMTLTAHATEQNPGHDPPPLTYQLPEDSGIHLPESFANVPYIDEYAGDIRLQRTPAGRPNIFVDVEVCNQENEWLEHIHGIILDRNGALQELPITYFGFFSKKQPLEDIRPAANIGVFPVLPEKAASMAMQKHAMLMIMKATEFVNPGQIPVIVGDCPLYAQQKKCQWAYPDDVGEHKIVSFIGFLHIEMASQECGGKLLAGSGWERIFEKGKVFTHGTAKSLLGGSNVKRTRYAYQLTLAFLHVLKLEAYNEYMDASIGPHEPIDVWEERLSIQAPTIQYWRTVTDYLLTTCQFVRGQRSGDWCLTLNALEDLCPWFFVFSHTHYARWLPVFLRDMATLPDVHPGVQHAFVNGKFVVQRSSKKFSLMALDQSQEHSIKFLKEDSGAKGKYGQQEEKDVIELSKSEVLRLTEEFESACLLAPARKVSIEHPEASETEQNKFLGHLRGMLEVVEDGRAINPFKEMGSDLVTLDSGEIMDPEIIKSLNEASGKGKEMYDEFVKDRIEQATKPLSDIIPRVKMYTFSNQPPADLRKGVNKVTSYKANTALVTKLFLSLKARPDADIEDFFRHENQREPPSLCDQGKMITGTKSALLGCLPGMPEPGRSAAAREATVVGHRVGPWPNVFD